VIDIQLFFVWMLLGAYLLFDSWGGIEYLRQRQDSNPVLRWIFSVEHWLTQIIFSSVIFFLLWIGVLDEDDRDRN